MIENYLLWLKSLIKASLKLVSAITFDIIVYV